MKKMLSLLLSLLLGASCCMSVAAAETESTVAAEAPEPLTEVPAAPQKLLYGDANGDGMVNINDATHGQKFIAEIITADELNFDAADVDFDGDVTIQDVSIIQKYLAEFISDFDIPKELTLSPDSLHLEIGESVALTTSYTAGDGAVSFSANDPNVATVDENGVVTAVGEGNAVITAKAGKKQAAYCTVEVNGAVTEVVLNQKQLLLKPEEAFTLTASGAEGETIGDLTFASSDGEVAAVDENGVVTALKDGSATVTVTARNGISADCLVAVMSDSPEAGKLNAPTLMLGEGDEYPLTAFYNGTIPAVGAVYSSDNPAVAAVDVSTGRVTAVAVGYATVTVKSSNGLTANCYVSVRKAPTEVAFSNPAVHMLAGEKLPFYLRAVNKDESVYGATYESSDEAVCTVSETGVVSAHQAGEAIITATSYNGKTAAVTVTVLADAGEDVRTTAVAVGLLKDSGWNASPSIIIPKGSDVTVYGASDDGRWLKVQYGDHCGWVYNKTMNTALKNYTSVTLETLPVVADDFIFNQNATLKNIYKYIYYQCDYRSAAEKTIEEMAVHILAYQRGVCYQRAALMCYVCERMGKDAIYVSGNVPRFSNTVHKWTLVKTNDGWRHVDPTPVIGVEYFMVTDTAMGGLCTWDSTKYPAAQ